MKTLNKIDSYCITSVVIFVNYFCISRSIIEDKFYLSEDILQTQIFEYVFFMTSTFFFFFQAIKITAVDFIK